MFSTLKKWLFGGSAKQARIEPTIRLRAKAENVDRTKFTVKEVIRIKTAHSTLEDFNRNARLMNPVGLQSTKRTKEGLAQVLNHELGRAKAVSTYANVWCNRPPYDIPMDVLDQLPPDAIVKKDMPELGALSVSQD